jgi:hypothetical protein
MCKHELEKTKLILQEIYKTTEIFCLLSFTCFPLQSWGQSWSQSMHCLGNHGEATDQETICCASDSYIFTWWKISSQTIDQCDRYSKKCGGNLLESYQTIIHPTGTCMPFSVKVHLIGKELEFQLGLLGHFSDWTPIRYFQSDSNWIFHWDESNSLVTLQWDRANWVTKFDIWTTN